VVKAVIKKIINTNLEYPIDLVLRNETSLIPLLGVRGHFYYYETTRCKIDASERTD
jgi:hypothetical protein